MAKVGFNQELHFKNVISRYYETSANGIGACLEDALGEVFAANYTLTAGFFYSINSDIRNFNSLIIQVFLPVDEEWANNLPEEYRFQSYFQVNHLMANRIVGDSVAAFKTGLTNLIAFIADHDLTITSPSFYYPKEINGQVYTDILIGVKIPED